MVRHKGREFVLADIPGLIEGASEGAGLGIRFLKHLTRNRILLHIVDMAPFDGVEPAAAALSIVRELERFSPTLAARERWLVLNKIDMLDAQQLAERRAALVEALDWQGPVYEISAISGTGTQRISQDMMLALEKIKAQEAESPELAEAEREQQNKMQQEARDRIEALREQYRQEARQQAEETSDDDDEDDDDYDVEVEYAP